VRTEEIEVLREVNKLQMMLLETLGAGALGDPDKVYALSRSIQTQAGVLNVAFLDLVSALEKEEEL